MYAEENNAEIFTTATQNDGNYYALSKLGYKTYKALPENTDAVLLVNAVLDTTAEKVEFRISPYCDNGTYFDKYGNRKEQKAFIGLSKPSFAEAINSKLKNPCKNITAEAEKEINAVSTGAVTNDEIIASSSLFDFIK